MQGCIKFPFPIPTWGRRKGVGKREVKEKRIGREGEGKRIKLKSERMGKEMKLVASLNPLWVSIIWMPRIL